MSVPRFFAFLINHPFGDPGLMIEFSYEKRALLFDIGDVSLLSERQLLGITHIFVTHTHIDHFFGFDRIIRLFLGRNRILHVYGPPGFFQNIEGKLSGYQWNILNNYEFNFSMHVTEIHRNYAITQIYDSKKIFKPSNRRKFSIENGVISSGKAFDVISVTLDHGTPCLGFSFREKPRIKILPDRLESMGLAPGKWLKDLQHCLSGEVKKNTQLQLTNRNSKVLSFNMADLKNKITKVLPGQKITYITDVNLTTDNKKAMLKLAHKSTHLFIEATFATEHEHMAMGKYHLTAKQAGQMARISESENYTLFHHSGRYIKCPNRLKEEAEAEFRGITSFENI